ncbi:unnamed protein product [Amaranthus hypochondriacus]
MSWLKFRGNLAMEIKMKNKNKTNLSHIRSFADIVVLQVGNVVANGANLLHNHIGNENIEKFKDAVKRLEEFSKSCRGEERIVLLRRWLISLKQLEGFTSIENNTSTCIRDDHHKCVHQQLHDLEWDHIQEDAHLNILDVVYHNHVVEGIVLSMILEAPNEEEIILILDIFRLSLMGGRKVHESIMNNIQDLAKVFSSYHEEVLLRREELLQYAQIAITGLKVNADIWRIDTEVSTLTTKLHETKIKHQCINDDDRTLWQQKNFITLEALKESLLKIRLYLKIEALLLHKKAIRDGDSLEDHAQKVNKLKVLLNSLNKSTLKAERQILDQRTHKDEAVHFRLLKATEVSQIEQELLAEIETLEQRKDALEVEFRKIDTSLVAAKTRLRNVKEERDYFDEASNEILHHIQFKEEELSKSISCCQSEVEVITTLIKFLEDAWDVQLLFSTQTDNKFIDEIEKHSNYQAEMMLHHLNIFKVEVGKLVTHFRILIRQLKSSEEPNHTPLDDESFPITITRSSLESKYIDLEVKLRTTFEMVEGMKQIYTQSEDFQRNNGKKIEELLSILKKMEVEFQSMEKPSIEIKEKQLRWEGNPLKLKPNEDEFNWHTKKESNTNNNIGRKLCWNLSDLEEGTPESNSAKLTKKSHFRDDSIDWEFDALEY